MAKDDVAELPPFPRKRRALERAPDVHVARWAAGENARPAERQLAEAERLRRKQRKGPPVILGVLIGDEGATPAQKEQLKAWAVLYDAEQVHSSGRLQLAAEDFILHREWDPEQRMKNVVLASTVVIAAPPRPHKGQPTGVWGAIRYAKHRSLPVRVVLPDGEEYVGE